MPGHSSANVHNARRPGTLKNGDRTTVTNHSPSPMSVPEAATTAPSSSSKRRGRGSRGRGRGPRWVPVQNGSGVDRNNEETFATNDANWTEEWSQQRSLVDAFEQFKRQQVITHKAGVPGIAAAGTQMAAASDLRLDPAVVAFDVISSSSQSDPHPNQDLLQQILEATDIFGWNSSPDSGAVSSKDPPTDLVFPSTNDYRTPSIEPSLHSPEWPAATRAPAFSPSVLPGNYMLSPLTQNHKRALMQHPTQPIPWAQPNTTSPEARVSWMSQNELETVLRLQLAHMEKANQVLTRPQTVRLESEISSLGHITSCSSPDRDYFWSAADPDLARRSLLCECVLARHLEADLFHRGPCPLAGTEWCVIESPYLDLMYIIEEGFQAFLHFQNIMLSQPLLDREAVEEAESALTCAVRICLDSETPPISIDRSCRRLMLLADHPKGLRLLSLVYSSLVTFPLGAGGGGEGSVESGVGVWLLTACLRNFRLLQAICRAGTHSPDFAFLVPLLRHTIDHRSVIPVSGPHSLACLVKDFCWERLASAMQNSSGHEGGYFLPPNGDMSSELDHMSPTSESLYLERIWLCMLHTLARQVEAQRCSMSSYLLRNLILGYFQYLIPFNLRCSDIQNSLYVPNPQAVIALSDPGLSVIFTLLLLLVQDPDPPTANTPSSFSQSCTTIAQVFETSPLETAGYKFDDAIATFVGVGLILRAAVERCVQTPNLLDAGSGAALPAVRVLSVLPSINVVFQTIRLALNSELFSALLKAAFAVSGTVVESCLVRLHDLFPGR